MTSDYFEAKHIGGDRNSVEIEVKVDADHVMDFAHEIRSMTIDAVMRTIDEVAAEQEMWSMDVVALKGAIEKLKGEQNEVHKE